MTAPPNLTIPQIRERMYELAAELACPELAYLADATKRRYHGRSPRVHARRVTGPLAAAVRAYVRDHPEAHFEEVAPLFGIKGGRVSEIMFGKRGASAT